MYVLSHPAKKRKVVGLAAFMGNFLVRSGGSIELSAIEIAYTVS